MLSVDLADTATGKSLHLVDSLVNPEHGKILIAEQLGRAHGLWKTAQITTQTTTTVVAAVPGAGIVVTDLLINAKKKAAATMVIQFSDGTNTEIFAAPDMINAPVNQSFHPQGRMWGWTDADIQVVTADANPTVTITVMYYHIINSLDYGTWDGLR